MNLDYKLCVLFFTGLQNYSCYSDVALHLHCICAFDIRSTNSLSSYACPCCRVWVFILDDEEKVFSHDWNWNMFAILPKTSASIVIGLFKFKRRLVLSRGSQPSAPQGGHRVFSERPRANKLLHFYFWTGDF